MSPGDQLLARLGLDTSGFKAGLKDAHSTFEKFARTVGIGLSVAGVAGATRELVEYGARVYDLSQRFGVSTTSIQKFGIAAEESGSSMEGITKGFNKLEIAISRALGGSATVLKSFAALGITIEDLKNLSPDELMLKIGKSSMNAADMVTVLGKSALELRPTLAGLADGSIELGDAIDAGMIKKLKEADKVFVAIGRSFRINIANELSFLGDGIKKMFTGMRDAAVAEFRAIQAAAKGNFGEVIRQAELAKKAMSMTYEGAFKPKERTPEGEGASNLRRFAAAGDGIPTKSQRELDAEKKDRDRFALGLKDLADNGPATFATGTPQMAYSAQQARLVEQLEAEIHQYRLTGISPSGMTPEDRLDAFGRPIRGTGMISRADAIRQTLPIKETEKEVGIYSTAFKTALDSSALLTDIRDEIRDGLE